jgi:hypothetical protein
MLAGTTTVFARVALGEDHLGRMKPRASSGTSGWSPMTEVERKPMGGLDDMPKVFHTLRGDAVQTRHTPYGSVGTIFSGHEIEAVWVRKQDEEVDPGWFTQPTVDLIVVVHGRLKVEFERPDLPPCVLECGDVLVLPPNTRCRAYRWPRDATEAAVFVAVYPKKPKQGAASKSQRLGSAR